MVTSLPRSGHELIRARSRGLLFIIAFNILAWVVGIAFLTTIRRTSVLAAALIGGWLACFWSGKSLGDQQHRRFVARHSRSNVADSPGSPSVTRGIQSVSFLAGPIAIAVVALVPEGARLALGVAIAGGMAGFAVAAWLQRAAAAEALDGGPRG